jgi:type IV secretory pathway VirB10-like protein
LIPALSTVLGKYDSKVALGQGRNLIAWSAMYFPDGSELNLAGMQAYDTSGAAGLEADVDNHYLRMFGLTFAMSMITAGVQTSVPQTSSGNSTPTTQQTIATALAQQYGNLGAQIIGKYMAVQPTLRNVAGERFTIMVPRTMVFKKVWRQRCAT